LGLVEFSELGEKLLSEEADFGGNSKTGVLFFGERFGSAHTKLRCMKIKIKLRVNLCK
jgi:hypothetical protein